MDGPASHPLHRGSSQRSLRVLLAEDLDDARRPLKYLLEADGHLVVEADNGPDALSLLLSEPFDLALVDIGLPGMNGYEVARQLRQQTAGTQPRLYAVTGYGRPEDKTDAMAAGFDYHLVKPVDVDTLRELVGRLGG